MKILITGATGLVGSKLLEKLFTSGHDDIRILTRSKSNYQGPFPVELFEWDPVQGLLENGALENVDTIINLAGENVADGRWSEKRKRNILESRVKGLELITNQITTLDKKPTKLISSSAIGIYGDRGDEVLTEESSHGSGFLADVCKRWEYAALEHGIAELESHCLRTGIVLSTEGGALKKMLPPFKMGVGGNLADGKQYMSWIHIDDLVGQIIYLLENKGQHKIYNAVAPQAVTNSVFTKTLGKQLRRPTLFPVPGFMLKLIFGEMSEVLLGSQNVTPQNFNQEGYEFKYKSLDEALKNLFFFDQSGDLTLKKYQYLPNSKSEVFSFFSDEKNLEKITPPEMQFRVDKMSTKSIQDGSIIDYKLKVHGIPMRWKSKISSFITGDYFIDEQLSGPYNKWVHRHEFIEIPSGTLIKDFIVYRIPLGILGRIFAGPFIRKDLNNVFNYRVQAIDRIFR